MDTGQLLLHLLAAAYLVYLLWGIVQDIDWARLFGSRTDPALGMFDRMLILRAPVLEGNILTVPVHNPYNCPLFLRSIVVKKGDTVIAEWRKGVELPSDTGIKIVLPLRSEVQQGETVEVVADFDSLTVRMFMKVK